MKGLIFDIKRFAVHDGPGIRTTIFFKGCPLSCWWCHNPESQSQKPELISREVKLDGKVFQRQETVGRMMTVKEVMAAIDRESVFYNESGGGVTLSGGEPLMQQEFALALLESCNAGGYHTTLDTCGYVQAKVLERASENTGLFLYDLKHPDSEAHKRFTGVGNQLILSNLALLAKLHKQVIIRIPVIPGINDAEDTVKRMMRVIRNAGDFNEVHLLPFHNLAGNKYERFRMENKLQKQENLKTESLEPIKQQFEAEGFEVRIGG